MMKKYTILVCFLGLAIFTGCGEQLDQTLLYGTWQADLFIETGKPKELNLSNMKFSFNDKDIYTYQSNLKYKEAGIYRLDGDKLYSTDTLSDQRIEKAVRILKLTKDSLQLGMNNGGIEQEIFLHKVQ